MQLTELLYDLCLSLRGCSWEGEILRGAEEVAGLLLRGAGELTGVELE